TMNKPHTLYHIVLDRSGSMSDCIDTTISGFKEQIQTIQNLSKKFPDQEITIGLTMFNSDIHHLYFNRAAEKAEPLTNQTYVPDGFTALFDGIVKSCERIESSINESGRKEDTTVVMIILTDGHENASQSANLNDVRQLISRLEATGAWTFNFLGATLDAMDVAVTMNFQRKNSMAFEKKNMKEGAFKRMSNYMEEYIESKDELRKMNRPTKNINIDFNKDEQ
ncbi:MAG: VWA domain-containing protein, partial [Chitinophagaceae bacterium]